MYLWREFDEEDRPVALGLVHQMRRHLGILHTTPRHTVYCITDSHTVSGCINTQQAVKMTYKSCTVEDARDDARQIGRAVELPHVRRKRHERVGDGIIFMDHICNEYICKRVLQWMSRSGGTYIHLHFPLIAAVSPPLFQTNAATLHSIHTWKKEIITVYERGKECATCNILTRRVSLFVTLSRQLISSITLWPTPYPISSSLTKLVLNSLDTVMYKRDYFLSRSPILSTRFWLYCTISENSSAKLLSATSPFVFASGLSNIPGLNSRLAAIVKLKSNLRQGYCI
jgi:hypothetical protein